MLLRPAPTCVPLSIPLDSPCAISTAKPGADAQLTRSRPCRPVTEWWRNKYESDAHRMWDRFYHNNENNFFKDRHYLHREWQVAYPKP